MKLRFRLWSILPLIYFLTIPAYGQERSSPDTNKAKITRPAIPALTPRDGKGYQFVLYGDSCLANKLPQHDKNFTGVNNVLARLEPKPQFICFMGDNIAGYTTDLNDLRAQWRYWLNKEMSWLDKSTPVYQITSNHNTFDMPSEKVFREIFSDIPQNGPDNQKGLSYFIRKNDLLLVFVNTAFSGLASLGPGTHLEHQWLDKVLTDNQDARYKLVLGHHPVLPVNGYEQNCWAVNADEGTAFWDVLVRHGVSAYICSHIIAFDVRVKQGVPQILTGGAGTFAGPGGFMPGQTEYLHLVQMAIDPNGLRFQVLDDSARLRESLTWPLTIPPTNTWTPFMQTGPNDFKQLRESQDKKVPNINEHNIMLWRFTGQFPSSALAQDQTLLAGIDVMEAPPVVWIGLDTASRLTVCLVPVHGGGSQIWKGPALSPDKPFDIQVAIHTDMGPGGILWRSDEKSPWSSLISSSSRGAENTTWPTQWLLGKSMEQNEKKFNGKDLTVSWKLIKTNSVR